MNENEKPEIFNASFIDAPVRVHRCIKGNCQTKTTHVSRICSACSNAEKSVCEICGRSNVPVDIIDEGCGGKWAVCRSEFCRSAMIEG